MKFLILEEHHFQLLDFIMSLFFFFFFIKMKIKMSWVGPNCRVGQVTPIQQIIVFGLCVP